jgi:hypothetical protein
VGGTSGAGRRSPVADCLPGVDALTTYQQEWLAKDVVAGLVLSALLVPQGMACSELAGLTAVTGLYTSVLGLLGIRTEHFFPTLDDAVDSYVALTGQSWASPEAAP